MKFAKLFHYLLDFLLFMDPTALFDIIYESHDTIIFTFIYSIFNKKFSVPTK